MAKGKRAKPVASLNAAATPIAEKATKPVAKSNSAPAPAWDPWASQPDPWQLGRPERPIGGPPGTHRHTPAGATAKNHQPNKVDNPWKAWSGGGATGTAPTPQPSPKPKLSPKPQLSTPEKDVWSKWSPTTDDNSSASTRQVLEADAWQKTESWQDSWQENGSWQDNDKWSQWKGAWDDAWQSKHQEQDERWNGNEQADWLHHDTVNSKSPDAEEGSWQNFTSLTSNRESTEDPASSTGSTPFKGLILANAGFDDNTLEDRLSAAGERFKFHGKNVCAEVIDVSGNKLTSKGISTLVNFQRRFGLVAKKLVLTGIPIRNPSCFVELLYDPDVGLNCLREVELSNANLDEECFWRMLEACYRKKPRPPFRIRFDAELRTGDVLLRVIEVATNRYGLMCAVCGDEAPIDVDLDVQVLCPNRCWQ